MSYKLYSSYIRDYDGTSDPLWFQSWLNFHETNEVLQWHSHYWDFHGYISIDPKDTTTVFNNFEIKNKVGQIYIGPGGEEFRHKVRVDKNYNGKRITLGFDVTKQKNRGYNYLGLIPIL